MRYNNIRSIRSDRYDMIESTNSTSSPRIMKGTGVFPLSFIKKALWWSVFSVVKITFQSCKLKTSLSEHLLDVKSTKVLTPNLNPNPHLVLLITTSHTQSSKWTTTTEIVYVAKTNVTSLVAHWRHVYCLSSLFCVLCAVSYHLYVHC